MLCRNGCSSVRSRLFAQRRSPNRCGPREGSRRRLSSSQSLRSWLRRTCRSRCHCRSGHGARRTPHVATADSGRSRLPARPGGSSSFRYPSGRSACRRSSASLRELTLSAQPCTRGRTPRRASRRSSRRWSCRGPRSGASDRRAACLRRGGARKPQPARRMRQGGHRQAPTVRTRRHDGFVQFVRRRRWAMSGLCSRSRRRSRQELPPSGS